MNRATIPGAATALMLLTSCQEAGPGDEPAAADIKALMVEELEPAAEIYWKSTGWIINEEGEHSLTPTTEEGWDRTLQATIRVQEIARQLQGPQYSQGRDEVWGQFAQGLVDIAAQAEQTVIDRDSDAIMEVGGVMYNICEGCHRMYLPAEPEA